jgi:hypothetical protein
MGSFWLARHWGAIKKRYMTYERRLLPLSRLSGRNPATAWETVAQVAIEEWAVIRPEARQ